MGGGNSHDRRLRATERKRIAKEVFEQVSAASPNIGETPKTTGQKWIEFFEHQWFLTVAGIVLTLLSFMYMPFLAGCGVVVILTFHKVGVVKGKSHKVQIANYGMVVIVTLGLLYGAGVLIRKNIPQYPHYPTLQEFVQAVVQAVKSIALPSPEPAATSAPNESKQLRKASPPVVILYDDDKRSDVAFDGAALREDYTGVFRFPSYKGQIKVQNKDFKPETQKIEVRILLSHSITMIDQTNWSLEETRNSKFPVELRIEGRNLGVGDWWYVPTFLARTRWSSLEGEIDVFYGGTQPTKANFHFEGPPQ